MKAGKCRIIEFIEAVLADSAVKREKTVSGRGGRIEPEFTAAEEGHRRCGGGAGEAMELERQLRRRRVGDHLGRTQPGGKTHLQNADGPGWWAQAWRRGLREAVGCTSG